MSEEQRKFDETVKNMFERINKPLRIIRRDACKCAVECYDNESFTMEKIQNCLDNCTLSQDKADSYVKGEVGRLQGRLDRCLMDCNDEIRDLAGPVLDQSTINKYKDKIERCSTNCLETFYATLQSTEEKIKQNLESRAYEYKSNY